MVEDVTYQYRVQLSVTLRKGPYKDVGGPRKVIETITVLSEKPMMKGQVLARATQMVNELG